MIAVLFTAFLGAGAQQPGAPGVQPSSPAQSPAGGRGRGPAGPSQPTPRLPDGTPNLGRVPGEMGVWNVPYITNMGERVIEEDGKTYVERHPPAFGRGRGAPAAGRDRKSVV